MSGIFISYRREDTADTCDRLDATLVSFFGRERIFKDKSSMISGRDFVDQIQQAIAQCNVMLVLIGPRWLQLTGPSGARRIDEPSDYVRQEIELARQNGVEIIPVLAQGARMPKENELPPSIAFLHRLDAAPVRPDPDYPWDTQRLIQKILTLTPQLTPRFNPEAALVQARQGSVPAGWMVWHAGGAASLIRAFRWFYTVGLFTAVLGLFLTFASSGSEGPPFARILAAALLVGGLAGVIGLVTGILDAGRALFVLTPDGVVQRTIRATHVIDFASTESISMRVVNPPMTGTGAGLFSSSKVTLMMLGRDGKISSWKFDLRFGRPEAIIQAITAAHTRYLQSHRGLGVPQPAAYQAGAMSSGQLGAPAPMGAPIGAAATISPPQIIQDSKRPSAVRAGVPAGLITAGAIMLILVLLVVSGFPMYQWQMYIYIAVLVGSLSAGFLTVRQARALGASIVAGLALGISLWLFFASIVPAQFPDFYGLYANPGEVGFNVGVASLVLAFVGGVVGKLTVRGQ